MHYICMRQWRKYEKTYRINHNDFYSKGKHLLLPKDEKILLGGNVTITEKMDGKKEFPPLSI